MPQWWIARRWSRFTHAWIFKKYWYPGSSPVQLKLKIGIPVMLLRNLGRQVDLCHGCRLRIVHFYHYNILAKILTGSRTRTLHYILRITLTSGPENLYFTLVQRQYPICPCFAMSINKSKDQFLHTVGLYLHSPVLSHGQLYVALSRVTDVPGLKALSSSERRIQNVIYADVLRQIYPV